MRSSWNPLRCGDARLPVNVVLISKLMALCLLLTGQLNLLPEPWRVIAIAAAIALLLNRYVRLSSLVLAASILPFGQAPSAFLLALAAVYRPFQPPWRSWNWLPAAIVASVLLQSSILLFTGSTHDMFFYAMLAAALLFVDWPRSRWLVIYDGDCGFCLRSKGWFERFDLEELLDWRPFQSGAGRERGISDAEARERVYLVTETKTYGGFRAIRMMLLFNPITYLAMAALIAAAPGNAALYRRIAVAVLLVFFLITPLGEWGYRLVARNRGRLGRNSSCPTS